MSASKESRRSLSHADLSKWNRKIVQVNWCWMPRSSNTTTTCSGVVSLPGWPAQCGGIHVSGFGGIVYKSAAHWGRMLKGPPMHHNGTWWGCRDLCCSSIRVCFARLPQTSKDFCQPRTFLHNHLTLTPRSIFQGLLKANKATHSWNHNKVFAGFSNHAVTSLFSYQDLHKLGEFTADREGVWSNNVAFHSHYEGKCVKQIIIKNN